jgi:hypothetical protein
MDTSDDAIINETPAFSAPKEVFTSEDLLEPGKKKKKQRAAHAVNTSDWAPPLLAPTGLLGLGSKPQ